MNVMNVEPELIGRKDTEHGNWSTDSCNPRRGEPMTNIVERHMVVPTHDTELARVIRAHELMHAKVSPAESMIDWVNRKIASHASMVVVEELRVNFLCGKAGFDVKGNLTDGGETADGERTAAVKDWEGAVRMSIATAGTASNKAFLNGIRRHNREWAVILTDISKRAVKEMVKAHKTGTLASTAVHAVTKLAPMGFAHTERIAEWVDRLCATVPEEPEPEASSGASSESEEEEATSAPTPAPKKRGRPPKNAGGHSNVSTSGTGSATGKPYPNITPSARGIAESEWEELRIEVMPMPRHTKGSIGKKRTASNVGKSPRRMHRLLTDPEKRVFDKVSRGKGGVVVIDASGSMSFTHDQIRAIAENAPGATVAVYSDKGDNGTNMWVIAKDGRMVNDLPEVGYGNGVDFPALEWAVKNRQRASSPIIWVTDGGVCPKNGGFHNVLAMQCITFCKKHNIIVLPYVEQAVNELRKMKNGAKGATQWPPMLSAAYEELMGKPLS
jgi:hypothetical protein